MNMIPEMGIVPFTQTNLVSTDDQIMRVRKIITKIDKEISGRNNT